MEEFYKLIASYYDTLSSTGYLPIKKATDLIVLDFLLDIVQDPDYLLFVTDKEQKIVNSLYKCVTEENCLL